MHRSIRTRRRFVAGSILLALALAAGITGVALDPSSQAVPARGEGPPALERFKALPGNGGMAEEGPGGAADAEFRKRAYPADTISVAAMSKRVRRSPPRPSGRSPARAAAPASGCRSARARPCIRPARSSPRRSTSRTRTSRAGARRRWRSTRPGAPRTTASSTSRPQAAASGARTGPAAATRTGSTSAARSASTRPARSHRPATTRAGRPSTSGPARPTSAAAAASPASASTGRRTAATRGPDRSAKPSSRARASARSSSSPAIRTRSTWRRRSRCAACRRRAAPESRGPFPDAAEVGSLQVDERRRDVELRPQRRRHAADCTGSLTEYGNPARARRAACAHIALDPSNPEIVYAALVRARRLALAGRRRDLDADQAVPEPARSSRHGRRSP